MFMKKEPDLGKILTTGTYLLFVLQNNFFIQEEESIEHVFDDCIKSYVGEDSYRRFIDKHKKLRNPLLDGNKSPAYFASNLIPPEPDTYPITVDVAQEKYPYKLLDVVTLEVQYFFSVPVTFMINKHFKNKGQHFLPHLIGVFSSFAGWSESGAEKAWEHGSERYNEYVDQLNLDQKRIGGLATKNIFNIEDFFASTNLTLQFVSSIEYYEEIFKNL